MKYLIVQHDKWRMWIFDVKDSDFAHSFAKMFGFDKPKAVSEIPYGAAFTTYPKSL